MLLAAAAMALVSFGVHTFIGGRYAARPLLAARRLPPATIWLNYLCWHIVTVLLLILMATFLAGAFGRVAPDAILLATIIAASISIVSLVVTLKAGIAPYRFPASYLLGATALFGVLGLRIG